MGVKCRDPSTEEDVEQVPSISDSNVHQLYDNTCSATPLSLWGRVHWQVKHENMRLVCDKDLHHSQTARMASSNTVFKPFCVRAEHSKYLTAPMSRAMATP